MPAGKEGSKIGKSGRDRAKMGSQRRVGRRKWARAARIQGSLVRLMGNYIPSTPHSRISRRHSLYGVPALAGPASPRSNSPGGFKLSHTIHAAPPKGGTPYQMDHRLRGNGDLPRPRALYGVPALAGPASLRPNSPGGFKRSHTIHAAPPKGGTPYQ